MELNYLSFVMRGLDPRIQLFAKIGIGESLAAPPLPHHRTCGSAYGGSAED
jgi:hypothetical protein